MCILCVPFTEMKAQLYRYNDFILAHPATIIDHNTIILLGVSNLEFDILKLAHADCVSQSFFKIFRGTFKILLDTAPQPGLSLIV